MSDELIRMLNGPIDKERALARSWGEYDLAKDAESDTDSDSTGGDGAPFPGYTFPGTVVPVFSGPRDERPPTMYGHFSKVPIAFQRICPLDQRTPTERVHGQHFLLLFHC